MSAILDSNDRRLQQGAPAKVGSDPTPGPARGQVVALPGFSNPVRKPEATLPPAAPPPAGAAIPLKAGRAAFDYAALKPGLADFLRTGAAKIREEEKSTLEAVCTIGRYLWGAKQMLPHGQFVRRVQSECGFSLRTAENYMRVSVFADKFANVANLSLAVVYLISAKSASPDVVSDVLARAANGELISCAEVTRMFRAAKAAKQLAGKETENKSRGAGSRHKGSSATNPELARANARVLLKRLGRDGAVLLLEMRESILEALPFLEQEIKISDDPD